MPKKKQQLDRPLMGKILIVEDEKDLATLLEFNLNKEGYKTVKAGDGELGLKFLKSEKPDLVLLDIMLPKLDGFDFLKAARQDLKVPVIILTAKKDEFDKVLGLELGADDYVTKPFSIRELMARIKTVLRRFKKSGPDQDADFVRVGELEVDMGRFEVRVGGAPILLSSKEFEFLKCLLQADGKALTREQLLTTVWGYDQSVEIDTRTVDQHISRLRNKLGVESKRLLTVKNIGYRFKTG
jgi:DNA-binding response OmpR family regulator